jgi:UDP-GlcNAc:undecaprenyl-phosphate/decaprenyl-phosphate GlcNAc-1-phosphate transferase
MYEKTLVLFILANIPIIFYYNKLVKFIKINDIPDNIRKFQAKETPLFGGILIIYNLFILFTLDYFIDLNPLNYFLSSREYFVFFIGVLSFFVIGLYDDKYNLTASKKLTLNSFLILFLILIDDKLLITEIHFSFNLNAIELRNFSYPFTILCILLLVNAINMFDGVNLQAGVYCIFVFTFLLVKEFYIFINLIVILSLILFLIYNYRNKAYLGDSGTQVLAFIMSYILIKSHNAGDNIAPDQIFVILSLPGLDMFRLFLARIVKGIHPFRPDRNHIHHLIVNKYGEWRGFIIVQFVIIFNLIIYEYSYNKILSIILIILLYLAFYLVFKNKRKKI